MMRFYTFARSLAGFVFFLFVIRPCDSDAASPLPPENGSELEAYQDGFNDSVRRPEWIAVPDGNDCYIQQGGVVRAGTGPSGNPHLALNLPGYDPANQEILARIRITRMAAGDFARAGLALGIDAGSGESVNFHFRYGDFYGDSAADGIIPRLDSTVAPTLPEGTPIDGTVSPLQAQPGLLNHLEFLDDFRAWGTELYFEWQTNEYYWVRFRQQVDANTGAGNLSGKIWRANGTTAEPANWQVTWTYTGTPANPRLGLAGLAASADNSIMEMDCDYVLIKAAGLPKITVGAPEMRDLNVVPGNLYHPAANGISFRVSAPFDVQTIEMKVNGVDQSSKLSVTGPPLEKQVEFKDLAPGQSYSVQVRLAASSGAATQKNFSFSTLIPATELRIKNFLKSAGKVQFTYEPLPGMAPVVQYRDQLTAGDWQERNGILLETVGAEIQVTDPDVTGNSRFYRVVAF